MTIDKLNNLSSKYPAIDYELWFSVMDIPKEDKDKRIELAEKIDDIFLWLFSLITLLATTQEVIDTESLVLSVQYRLGDLVSVESKYVSEHIVRIAGETVESTITHMDDEYFFSPQRASEIAADEAHTISSYEELQEAWDNGYTKKIWNTQRDRRVRRSHAEADKQTVDIDKMFIVNGYEMATVKDTENGAPLSEVSRCRCYVTFK